MAKNDPLILVDGSSYLFRAFHALPPLMTSKGQPTGAVKGVINMIRSLINSYPESYVAVVFDAKGKTFRNDMYSEYKANRPPMPDDLRSQIEPIHQIIKAMGLPLIVVDGVEADDVIGTLAQQAWEQKMPTLISTGDKDLAQLVNEHVTLLNTMNNETLDHDGVKNKFGLPPEKIIEYLALMGDKADNIPGIPSVGPKTAVKWLDEFGSLEELVKRADEVKGKVGEKLRDNLAQLELSKELATIKLDVELDFGPKDLVHLEPNNPDLLALYKQMEFRSWIKELEGEGIEASVLPGQDEITEDENEPETIPVPDKLDYQLILDEKALENFLALARNAGRLSISVETDGGHYKQAEIIGLSLCSEPGIAFYIPLAHTGLDIPAQLEVSAAFFRLKPVLEDKHVFKIGHDLKTISHLLHAYGIDLKGRRYDTMLQSYVLNSVAHKHTLDRLVSHYLELDKKTPDELLGKGRTKIAFAELEVEQALQWSAENADFCFRLHQILSSKLSRSGQLEKVYRYFEIALVPVLNQIEDNGVSLDVKALTRQSIELAERLKELELKAFELADEEFNLGSPKQLQKIFYEKLNYPVISKTAKGQPSTAEPVLQELALEYPLPEVILEHRGLSKLKSTYTDRLPLDINPLTGRIHTSYQQAVAATGRLSSTEPNLQNIPIRTEEGRRIRQAFIAGDGKVLMAADYSQVELRIMAHLSGDKGLCEAFSLGLDVHQATASEIFSVALDKVKPEQRRSAKAINFGLIYGMSAFGLAKQLKIGRSEAQEYVERYFQRYPGVRKYMDDTRMLANEQGYVETIFGRRLYLPDIKASNGMLRKAAERTAINAPMQGTAADIIKQAMVDIDHWLKVAKLDALMIMQVHDELVFEVAREDLQLLSDGVRFRMVSAASLNVPLVVDIGSGKDWNTAH
ncbi:MAG: DNA polymerase I [Gammaproteobacteria bacterium]|jgi:DNA polymerase I|nr:DNA polymerase I [Gammaproteobacteria bacterium]